MANIMRKMNMISRCEGIYRMNEYSNELPAIYHTYILAICKNPGRRQEWLAKHLCINKSSVTRHIAYLEKNGYVKRIAGEDDKREMLVYPTDKMLKVHPEIEKITKKWNALLAEEIGSEEIEIFHTVLDKIAEKSIDIIYRGEKQE